MDRGFPVNKYENYKYLNIKYLNPYIHMYLMG